MAFHTEFFDKMWGCELLHEILIKQGITEVFQLNEFGPPDYEIALSILKPRCARLGEQYSPSEAADWVVYASHESSITIAGDSLAGFFREKWPDWTLRTHQGSYSTGNLRGTWDTG